MTDFVQAIRKKYVDQDDDMSDQIYIPTDKTITTEIKLVGFAKIANIQKQLRLLSSIDLSNQKINKTGQVTSLDKGLNGVRVINLTDNHLNWSQLIILLKYLPNLQELIISSNELDTCLNQDIVYPTTRFPMLSSLVIGRTHLDWESLINISSRIWTHVTEIDLWDSQLSCDDMFLNSELNFHLSFVENLKSLRLSANNFVAPTFLNHMGPLKNLRDLDLSKCNLKSFLVDNLLSNTLENIVHLNISYNDIVLWSDISSLFKLQKLKTFICHENPFFTSAKVSKPLVVGRLKTITTLNREEITRTFRRDSEIYYLRSVMPDYRSFQEGTKSDFYDEHPRFNELVNIYGLPQDSENKKLQDKYLNLEFYFDNKTANKKVPRDMRVSNLRMLIRRLFKLSPSSVVRITCCSLSKDGEKLEYDLDVDSQTLSFYLNDNDKKIVITLKDY